MSFRIAPLHLACGNDSLRPALNYIKIENGFFVATDAHMLIKLHYSDISNLFIGEGVMQLLEGKFIHKDVWQRLIAYSEEWFVINDQFNISIKAILYPVLLENDIQFPDYQNIIPDYKNNTDTLNRIGINLNLLKRVQKIFKRCECFYNKSVFHFSQPNKAVVISGDNDSKSIALVMPLLITYQI